MRDLLSVKEVRCERLEGREPVCFVENKNPDGTPCPPNLKLATVLKTVEGNDDMPDQAWLSVSPSHLYEPAYHSGRPFDEVLTIGEFKQGAKGCQILEQRGIEISKSSLGNSEYRDDLVRVFRCAVTRRLAAVSLANA